MKIMIRNILIVCSLLAVGTGADCLFEVGIVSGEAEARVGRPLTPGSVAGVARRSTRRTIRRTSVYVATLPRGCTTIFIEGATLQQCGSTYYQPHNNQYVVVEVN